MAATVVSGPAEDVRRICAEFAAEGVTATELRVSHAFHSSLMDPMLEEFAAVAAGLTYSAPTLGAVSSVTGEPVDTELWCDPGYWVRQVREPVRFADGVRTLAARGVVTALELGPDAVLTAAGRDSAGEADLAFAATMRRDRDEEETVLAGLGRVHARGGPVDWAAFFAGSTGRFVDLPTYAFQRRRYWLDGLDGVGAPGGGPAGLAAGQEALAHPLLAAAVAGPDSETVVFTGRLAHTTQPWLADHGVLGTVLLPGTGFVEIALRAGAHLGCGRIEELTLERPLLLPDAAALRVAVAAAAEDGTRAIHIHTRTDGGEWIRHATGVLAPPADVVEQAADLAVWPPAGAEELPVADAYDRLAERGYDYGPAFQGLHRAWRAGDDVFAEVELPEADSAAAYLLHPALLDAAMHADLVADGGAGTTLLPFSWNGVELHRAGAGAVRVRLRRIRGEQETEIAVADLDGRPVLDVRSLVSREVSAEQLVPGTSAGLLRLDWVPVGSRAETAAAGAAYELLTVDSAPGDTPEAAKAVATEVLARLQVWLDAESEAQLVVRTTRAVAVRPGDTVDLAQAPVWGLVRAAQAENPGRIVLVDLDQNTELDPAALPVGEPELALRNGELTAPRLTPLAAAAAGATTAAAGPVAKASSRCGPESEQLSRRAGR
ncbi:polyketide synthase dehydratase domain-containing protein [Streptomyces sp. NPDC002690]